MSSVSLLTFFISIKGSMLWWRLFSQPYHMYHGVRTGHHDDLFQVGEGFLEYCCHLITSQALCFSATRSWYGHIQSELCAATCLLCTCCSQVVQHGQVTVRARSAACECWHVGHANTRSYQTVCCFSPSVLNSDLCVRLSARVCIAWLACRCPLHQSGNVLTCLTTSTAANRTVGPCTGLLPRLISSTVLHKHRRR